MTRELMPCGTPAAYKRHRAQGEEACQACRDAAAARMRALRAAMPVTSPRQPPSCGTAGAFERHRNAGEHCEVCWAAKAAYLRDYRARTGTNGNAARDRRVAEARERRRAFDAALAEALADHKSRTGTAVEGTA